MGRGVLQEEANRQTADIRIKMTPSKKAEYQNAALQDRIPEVSVWAKLLMDKRLKEQESEFQSGQRREAWPCPRCHRMNAPWEKSCDCQEKKIPRQRT